MRLIVATAAIVSALGWGDASAHQTAVDDRIVARLIAPTDGIVASRSATATVLVTRRGRPARTTRPRVRFASGGTVVVAAGRPVSGRGRYSVRFRLPVAGVWSYRITIGNATAGTGRVQAEVDSRLPGSNAYPICANAGAFWPTMTLAIDFGSAWVACKERGALARFDLTTSRTSAVLQLGGSDLIAVTTGFGSVWALDGSSDRLNRIDPERNTVVARINLGRGKAYNVWTGAGAVWVADDGTGEMVRIDPAANAVVARIAVGNGPADLVFQGTTAWITNHRDLGLVQLDALTNSARLLATIPGDAPERIAWAAKHLWITGRGTDLLEVDPSTGTVLRTVDIGAGGIDVVALGDTLWVPARNSATDTRGFPTMEALRRVDARTATVAASIVATGLLDVHGLVVDERGVWLADNTSGVLYRVAN